MATTTNYGWTTPDDTSLVKDGASAIRTLGTSVDTTTKNLNPSTTLGDIEYRSSTSNVNTRVGIGSSGQALTVVAGAPSWAASATSVLTTTGDSLYASAANTLARLGIGSTGQVLTVASGLPSWATPASGSMTLISTTTLTGASVALTSIPQTYKDLKLVIRNFIPATNNSFLRFRFNGDSGASRHYNGTSFTNVSNAAANTTVIDLSLGASSSVGTAGLVNVYVNDYTNAATWKNLIGYGQTNDGTTTAQVNFRFAWGFYNQTTAVTSITLLLDAGNFTSGTVLLYGVN